MVPYSGAELSRVEMATGDRQQGAWQSAFLSWDGRQRVAMIRPPDSLGRPLKVWLRIDGTAELVGSVRY